VSRTFTKVMTFEVSVEERFSNLENRFSNLENKYEDTLSKDSTPREESAEGSSTTVSTTISTPTAIKIKVEPTVNMLTCAVRLLLRLKRSVNNPGNWMKDQLKNMFEHKIFFGEETKTILGRAWRKTRYLFRQMVTALLRNIIADERDDEEQLVSVLENWPSDIPYPPQPELYCVRLTNEQLAIFWSATSPKLDENKRNGTEIERASNIKYQDLDITDGMKLFAMVYIGTLLHNDSYSALKERYLSTTTAPSNGKKIELEESLMRTIDPLTAKDKIPAIILNNVGAIKGKRGVKRKITESSVDSTDT